MKKKKELSEMELEALHQEFSQDLADQIYEAIEKMGQRYEKKHNYDSVISTFNVLLSISANCGIELGIPMEDFVSVAGEFWKNAEKVMKNDVVEGMESTWLEPKTKDPKKLS